MLRGRVSKTAKWENWDRVVGLYLTRHALSVTKLTPAGSERNRAHRKIVEAVAHWRAMSRTPSRMVKMIQMVTISIPMHEGIKTGYTNVPCC